MLLRPGGDIAALDADDATQDAVRHVAATRAEAATLDAAVAVHNVAAAARADEWPEPGPPSPRMPESSSSLLVLPQLLGVHQRESMTSRWFVACAATIGRGVRAATALTTQVVAASQYLHAAIA
jgi:hypothetical protein